jgi:hypothetical protein
MGTSTSREQRIEIEFLYLDLDVCTRCKGTDANLEMALRTIQEILQTSGTDVSTRKVLVDSEETARKLKFLSSPTIRINGRDIALDLRETPCDSCAESCACGRDVDCRVWFYEDKEYTEAPVPLIVDAILSAIYDSRSVGRSASAGFFELPENLRHFFEAKAAKKAAESCCAAEEKPSCCAPSEKSSCCGSVEPGAATCGCQ